MENKTVRINGYVYSPGTSEGFDRMRRLGFPRPMISIENKITKELKRKYVHTLRVMMADFRKAAESCGLRFSKGKITQDAITDIPFEESDAQAELLEFFEQMGKELKAAEDAQKAAATRSSLSSAVANLKEQWNQEEPKMDMDLNARLTRFIAEDQEGFIRRLGEDASDRVNSVIATMSVDKKRLYNENMAAIRTLYLDNAMQRVEWEEDYLKRIFLERISDYITGKSETLDIREITQALNNSAGTTARFFARDQLARLNKATTLAQFVAAGVTKVKWITSHDVRVRSTHRALDGRVFDINNLPPEIDDYNCRCGIVPAEYED